MRASLGPGGSRFNLSAEEGVYPRFGREEHSASAPGAFIVGTDNTFSPNNPGESEPGERARTVNIAVMSAIDAAVIHLIVKGMKRGMWSPGDPNAMQNPIIARYSEASTDIL